MKNSNKKIIIFSGKQFSGKDTVAKILLDRFKDFRRIGIADAIKMKFSKQIGVSVQEIEENKSKYRQDLIELGNWGRSQSPDYWLNSIIESEGNIVVTDVRMAHELDVFKKNGAISVRVEADEDVRSKRGILTSSLDETETQLDNVKDWDFVINNNGTYEELVVNADELISKINELCK